jgi:hypothetical protein
VSVGVPSAFSKSIPGGAGQTGDDADYSHLVVGSPFTQDQIDALIKNWRC